MVFCCDELQKQIMTSKLKSGFVIAFQPWVFCMQSFDEGSPDPQAHLVDQPLTNTRTEKVAFKPSEPAVNGGNGVMHRATDAPAARKAMANEWISPDYAGMGI